MNIDFPSSVLLQIDIQNDFCPNGALPIDDGDEVIEPLNKLALLFTQNKGHVIATQDWHAADHISFASAHPGKTPGELIDLPSVKDQVLWPDHCVQGTKSADFHEKLNLSYARMIIRKGVRQELDSYSAFFENDRQTQTGLDGFLKCLNVKSVFLGGLAADYCVFYSAMDAIRLGYKTYILKDAVRGVGYPEGSIEKAFEEMINAGAEIIDSSDLG